MTDNQFFTGERMIPKFADNSIFWEHIYRYKFALNFIKGKNVVDIASGEGYGTSALKKAGAKSIIGIDIAATTCKYAKDKYGNYFITGNAINIPIKSKSADTIISFETIEHLKLPELFLQECSRILTDDGTLVLSTPNLDSSMINLENEYHYKVFSIGELTEIVKRSFNDVKLYYQCPESLPLLNFRFFSSLRSPLYKYNKIKRIRNKIRYICCNHVINSKLLSDYKLEPTAAILKNESLFSNLANPYLVYYRARIRKIENPMFIILVARKKLPK